MYISVGLARELQCRVAPRVRPIVRSEAKVLGQCVRARILCSRSRAVIDNGRLPWGQVGDALTDRRYH